LWVVTAEEYPKNLWRTEEEKIEGELERSSLYIQEPVDNSAKKGAGNSSPLLNVQEPVENGLKKRTNR
jgi:hypothetical protein